MKWFRSIPVLLFVVLIIPSFAAVYKWVDEGGAVRYSDTPPENKKQVQKITTLPSPPLESIDEAQRILKKQLDDQKKTEQSRSINEQKAQQEQKESQQHLTQLIKSCGRARQELSTLQEGRAFRYDINNERVFLDDKTVNSEVHSLNSFIKAECKSSLEELKLQLLEAERFRAQQNIEDQCVFARQGFMMKSKPEAHTPSSELEEAKQKYDRWCKNATGDKTIILRRNIIRVP